MAPLLLIRSALDDEALGIEEKIALLTHGIADLTDVVALQITIEGGNLPLVVSQDRYADELRAAGIDPLTVLRTPPDTVGAFIASGLEREIRVDFVPKTGDWIATVMLPLAAPVANQRAAFSARVDLDRLRQAVAGHPFQRTGTIDIVDADGRQVLGEAAVDLTDRAIAQDALSRIETGTPVIAVESYTRPDGELALGAFAVPRAIPWAVLVEKSEADAYFAVGQMIRSLGIWIAVGLVAAAIGALIFAFRISRPILKIGEAATEVGKGNFAARVTDVHRRDEIGDLAERINTMIVQINERFQLAKFVSGGTIAAIQKSDVGGVKLGGERREVAILFADIRGYTAFAEPRDRRRPWSRCSTTISSGSPIWLPTITATSTSMSATRSWRCSSGEDMAADSDRLLPRHPGRHGRAQGRASRVGARHRHRRRHGRCGDGGDGVEGADGLHRPRRPREPCRPALLLRRRQADDRLGGGGGQDPDQSGLPARGARADQGQGQERRAQRLFGDARNGDRGPAGRSCRGGNLGRAHDSGVTSRPAYRIEGGSGGTLQRLNNGKKAVRHEEGPRQLWRRRLLALSPKSLHQGDGLLR